MLQVLLPQKDLQSERDTTAHLVSCSSRHFVVLTSDQDGASSLFPRSSITTLLKVLPTCSLCSEWFGVYCGSGAGHCTLWLFIGPAPPSHGPELELVLGRGGQHHGRGLCITAKWPRDEKETILHIPLADRGWEHFSFLRSRPIFIQHCTMWNLTLPNRTVPTSHSPSDQIEAIWFCFYEKETFKESLNFALKRRNGRILTGARCIQC